MYLGIDCSTQSLKILIINENKELIKEKIVVYDDDLPKYGTTNGFIRHLSESNNEIEHISTPTILFVEALELCIGRIYNDGFDLSKIKAISGSGQQHGSVWWKNGSIDLLNSLKFNSDKNLVDLFSSSFSLKMSPIWMDASTTLECKEISDGIGNSQILANITGSKAYERFTGPQIKRVYKYHQDIYEITERISLISSFLPSLLIGDYAPIDLSDGSGMNILDINKKKWNENLLDLIAPNLRYKLGEPVASDSNVGYISSYWCNKYGFSTTCEVFAFSGDNPCSLIGLNLNEPGDVGISLGTSDVLFGVTCKPIPNDKEGSILIHPQDINNYMMMLVYKNGATTRKYLRDLVHKDDKTWSLFNKSIKQTPPGSNGHIGFYYIEKEITPNILHSGIVKFNENDEIIDTYKINENDCRSIIESQVLSYKHHAQLLGLNKISTILVTGGGSVNNEILQIIADIFEIEVIQSAISNTAASGAAIRALNAYMKQNDLKSDSQLNYEKIIKPNNKNFSIYRELLARYKKLEDIAVKKINDNQ